MPFLVVVLLSSLFAAIPSASEPAAASQPVSWSIVASPNTGPQSNDLQGVSCVSSSSCMAVGYSTPAGVEQTLAEQWDGTSWSIDPSLDMGSGSSVLNGVSCVPGGGCIAVGTYGSGIDQTLIESWNGTAWSIVPSPDTSPSINNSLLSVSCVSATFCVASGYVLNGSGSYRTLVEQWNGTTWSLVSSPDVSTSTESYLSGVSCTSVSWCTAVGFSLASNGYDNTLIESWNGTAWSITPSPDTSTTATNVLVGVACATPTRCKAVGWYSTGTTGSNGEDEALIESWDGTSWSIDSAPASGGVQGILAGVSCPSVTTCTAVGYNSQNGSGSFDETFVGSWNASTWTRGQSADVSGDDFNIFTGVGCSSEATCTAVGYSSGSYQQTLIEQSSVDYDALSVMMTGLGMTDSQQQGGGIPPNCNCATKSPVNIATGDYYDTASDLTIPSAGIAPSFSRTYDAEAAQAEQAAGATPGPLGYGWTDNLGLSVAASGSAATVTLANGAEVPFVYLAQGATEPVGPEGATWCPSDASGPIYCAAAPRFVSTLVQNSSTGAWTYTDLLASPLTYTFTPGGTLTQIADAAGDTLTSSAYSPSASQYPCPTDETCTAWASIPTGETSAVATLVEAVNASGQLTEVFDADDGAAQTQTASFTYGGSGCSAWGSNLPADLCQVTDPGGLVTSFTYDSGSPSPYSYDELTMSSPASGTTTNTYDGSGRVTTQVAVTGGTDSELDFSYQGGTALASTPFAGLGGGTETQVTTWPNGHAGASSTMNYIFSNDVEVGTIDAAGDLTYRVVDPDTGLSGTSVDADHNASTTTFDNFENGSGGTAASTADPLLTQDALGDTTQFAYTADNQVWCEVDPADYLAGIRCPSTAPTTPPTGALGYTATIDDSSDHPLFVTDPEGHTTANAYTGAGSGVPAGLLYCTVDPVDYAAGVRCPAYGATHVAGTTTKTFDATGDVVSSTDADGGTTTSVYGSPANPGLVTSTTDPDGATTSFTYDAAGHVLSQTVSFRSYSASTLYGYDSSGRRFCEVAPQQAANGVTCPLNPPTSPPTAATGYTDTIYDAGGQVTSTTSPIGGTTQYGYDGDGRTICTVAPRAYAQGVRCPTSLPLATPTVGDDPYLGATITTYDAVGQVTQTTTPIGGITTDTYDPDGTTSTEEVEGDGGGADPNVLTTYTYDADNRTTSTTVGTGATTSTTSTAYDPDGNVYCSMSGNASVSGTAQCPAWQAAWITSPPIPSALYAATPTSSQADDVTTSFYDADGNLVQSTDPDVQTTISAFDADGRTYCTSDPTNVAAWLAATPGGSYPYDCPTSAPSAPPATGSDPGYSTTIYEADGQTLSSTDQDGDTTRYAYDLAGHQTTVTDPRGDVTTNCYYDEDALGGCAASAPAAGGAADALYSTTTPPTSADPTGGTTTYTYLPGGAPDITTTPAATSVDSYDLAGDLAGVTYSDPAPGYTAPANVSYTYFPDGSRASMTDGTGTTVYGEDADGDVTSQQFTPNSTSGLAPSTVAYSYFPNGDLSEVTYPSYAGESNPSVAYTYDDEGNMASETDWKGNAVSFSHDADGNETGQDNGVTSENPTGTSSTDFSYDGADQNTAAASTLAQSCSSSPESLVQSFGGSTGSRNADGQLTEYTTGYTGSCSSQADDETNYSYDPAGHVVYQGATAQGSSPNDVGYDPSGDPTTISGHSPSGVLDTYTQSFNAAGQVTAQTPVAGSGGAPSTFSYDSLGDQTSEVSGGTTQTSTFDAADQMTSASSEGATSDYLYNGDGLEAAAANTGVTVGPPTAVDGSNALEAVSCTSSTFCVAVDNAGGALTFNGTSWSRATTIDGTNVLESVSCAGTTFCVAVDNKGNALTTNGTSWSSASSIDGTNVLDAVSCASSTFCVAVDNKGDALTTNGTTWSSTRIDSTRKLVSVSCPSTTFCLAIDSSDNALTYNGTSWSSASQVEAVDTLESVSCASSTYCVAVDNAGHALTTNGTTWSSATPIDGNNTIDALSCTSSSSCVAVDNDGNALTTNGTSWSGAASIDGTRTIDGISCASSSFCVAVDNKGYAVNYGETPWSSASAIDGSNALESVSCVGTTFCAAVDNAGNALTTNGTSWSTASSVDGTNVVEAVSCASSTFCVAVDNKGDALTTNGTSWSSTRIDSTRKLVSVSCPSTTFCLAIDSSDNALIYNGTSWSPASQVEAVDSLESVSCASATYCVAVDNAGHALTYNGAGWSSAASIDGNNTLEAVSCSSSTWCVAVDNDGNALTYNGSGWSSASSIDGTTVLDDVSCASSSFCVAVDTKGNAVTYNGTSWSDTASVDSTRRIDSISCPTSSSCSAVDSSGRVTMFGTAQPVVNSQFTWDTNGSLSTVLSDGTDDYIYGPSDEPVEQINVTATPPASNPEFMTYTSSDSSWLITNTSGVETNFYAYDAFGDLSQGTPGSAFGYAGQYTDATTGLSNMRARWYEPQTGEFTTVDPDLAQTDQPYEYAGDDPVNEIDPNGMYHYRDSWYLGTTSELPPIDNAYLYFLENPHKIFPWSTGNCGYFYLGEDCHFDVHGTADHLDVTAIGNYSLTLTVENWCFTPGLFGSCLLGDPPGSKITFSIGEADVDVLQPGVSCGNFLYLREDGNSPKSGPLTNQIAPRLSRVDWHQQAVNFDHDLGVNRNPFLISNPGWSFS